MLAIGNTLSSRKPFMLWYPTGRTEEESWSSQVKFDCHAHVEHINQNSGKSLQPKLCENNKHADSEVLTE